MRGLKWPGRRVNSRFVELCLLVDHSFSQEGPQDGDGTQPLSLLLVPKPVSSGYREDGTGYWLLVYSTWL